MAAPEDWTLQEKEAAQAIIKNAVRLLEDASLLHGYERFGTAYTLATLAFEEAGKVALKIWADNEQLRKVDRRWSFHLRKQTAAGCLLLAHVAVIQIETSQGGRWETLVRPEQGTEAHSVLREAVAKALFESKERRLLDLIRIEAIEKSKQLGFYVDDWSLENGLTAGQFSSSECNKAIDEARSAIRQLRSLPHLSVARALYLLSWDHKSKSTTVSNPSPDIRSAE